MPLPTLTPPAHTLLPAPAAREECLPRRVATTPSPLPLPTTPAVPPALPPTSFLWMCATKQLLGVARRHSCSSWRRAAGLAMSRVLRQRRRTAGMPRQAATSKLPARGIRPIRRGTTTAAPLRTLPLARKVLRSPAFALSLEASLIIC
jgi:hypothetical protein